MDLSKGEVAHQGKLATSKESSWEKDMTQGMDSLSICQVDSSAVSPVNPLLDSMSHLEPSQQKKLYSRLQQYESLFLHGAEMPAAAHDAVARIQGGDHVNDIVTEAPYRTVPWKRDLIKSSVQDLLDQGLVVETNSSWASPVVLVE